MPELPEVEIYRKYIHSTCLHKTINNVNVLDARILENIKKNTLENRLKGSKFISTLRHGKYLFIRTDNSKWLMLHFGMTGDIKYSKILIDPNPHDRLILEFNNGYQLAYVNQRLFGKVGLVKSPEKYIESRALGPDALNLDYSAFKKAVDGRSGALKPLLLNQNVIAGLGNIYADEVLFKAGIHPLAKADKLTERRQTKLHNSILEILQTAVECKADYQAYPKDYLYFQRHKEGECPVCHGKLDRVKIQQRYTYFCPKCQK